MKLSRTIGIGLALFVPALAVAFTVPVTFQPGDNIEAATMNRNFSDIATDLTDLRTQLTTVQNALATSTNDLATARTELGTVKTELATAKSDIAKLRGAFGATSFARIDETVPQSEQVAKLTFRANSAGHLSTITGGSGWSMVTTRIYFDDSQVSRAAHGGSLNVPIKSGQVFSVSVDYSETPETPSCTLFFSPAEAGGSLPTAQ